MQILSWPPRLDFIFKEKVIDSCFDVIHKRLAFHVKASYFLSIITRWTGKRRRLILNPWLTHWSQFTVNTIQLLKFAFTFIGIKYGHNAYNMDFTFQRASVHILSLCLPSSESYLNSWAHIKRESENYSKKTLCC